MVAPLPFLDLDGRITRMQPLQTTTVYTPPTMKIQQTPNTISVGKGNNLGKNNNSGNLMNTVAGALSTGLSSYGSTGSVGQGVSSTVDSLIKSIPVAGQIISAVDMIADPLASAFGDAGATNQYNQAAERLINPLNSLEGGISNLIDGNSKEGWNDLMGVVLPGLAGFNDAKWEREKRSADASRERVLLNEKDKQRDVQQGYGWRYRDQPMQAANGGYLGYSDDVLGQSFAMGGELLEFGKGGKIHIKPENRGKFTAYKQRTGKTTEEALHSKNPHVRQMANFARNARHWKHEFGGELPERVTYSEHPLQIKPEDPHIQGYKDTRFVADNTSTYNPNIKSTKEALREAVQRDFERLAAEWGKKSGRAEYVPVELQFVNPAGKALSGLVTSPTLKSAAQTVGYLLPFELGGSVAQRPMVNEYNEGGTHDMNTSGYGGVPVDSMGNRTIVSANRPVATVEEGEVSWFDPNSKTTYVFSNKIRL